MGTMVVQSTDSDGNQIHRYVPDAEGNVYIDEATRLARPIALATADPTERIGPRSTDGGHFSSATFYRATS